LILQLQGQLNNTTSDKVTGFADDDQDKVAALKQSISQLNESIKTTNNKHKKTKLHNTKQHIKMLTLIPSKTAKNEKQSCKFRSESPTVKH